MDELLPENIRSKLSRRGRGNVRHQPSGDEEMKNKASTFFVHYDRNFESVMLGETLRKGGMRLCVKELILPIFPPVPFLWEGRKFETKCSKGPSSLLQRWNVHIRWSQGLLPVGPSYKRTESGVIFVNVLVIDHSLSKGEMNITRSRPTRMGNVRDIVNELERLDAIEITVADFSLISFEEQLLLIARSSVLLGMRGSDMAHAMHMSIGATSCCGVVEIIPDQSIRHRTPWALANGMGKLGIHYQSVQVCADMLIYHLTIISRTQKLLNVLYISRTCQIRIFETHPLMRSA